MKERKEIRKRKENRGGRETEGATGWTEDTYLYQLFHQVQMRLTYLYRWLCTGSIPGINDGLEPVQMPLFLVVLVL
jgi:hypothetical protein